MHVRARSWDVNDLSRQMLAEQGQPWLCRVPFADVSLAVECVVHSAMVTLEATWALDDVPLPPLLDGQLDCLFVMPLKDQVEYTRGPSPFCISMHQDLPSSPLPGCQG